MQTNNIWLWAHLRQRNTIDRKLIASALICIAICQFKTNKSNSFFFPLLTTIFFPFQFRWRWFCIWFQWKFLCGQAQMDFQLKSNHSRSSLNIILIFLESSYYFRLFFFRRRHFVAREQNVVIKIMFNVDTFLIH